MGKSSEDILALAPVGRTRDQAIPKLKERPGRCSSVVEQRFRKPQVKGSTPLTGSTF